MARGPEGVYTSAFKYQVLSQYQPRSRGHGFQALAKQFDIPGGARTVRRWHQSWDGTKKSLQSEPKPGKVSKLSNVQKDRHIRNYILQCNRDGERVTYRMVQSNVKKMTKKNLSLSQIQRIGKKELNISHKKTKRSLVGTGIVFHSFTLSLKSYFFPPFSLFAIDYDTYKEDVQKFRRKIQRLHKNKVVFLDQTGIELGATPRYGLAVSGHEAKIAMEPDVYYRKRVDIMAVISYQKPLSLEISPPSKRSKEGRKGYRKVDVLNFIRKQVAKDLVKLEQSDMTFVIDRGLRVREHEVMEALAQGNCRCVKQVLIIPKAAGKHVSPLDNCTWHQLKEGIRSKTPNTERATIKAIKSTWQSITVDTIHSYYRHCALTQGQPTDKDLIE
jgi:hypothetical protein